MSNIKAGKLRHFGVIEQLVSTQDALTGATREEWLIFLPVWAQINPMSGREYVAAQAVQAGVNTRITIREHDGILPSMRFRYRGTRYDILAVLPDPTLKRHINLMCESGVVVELGGGGISPSVRCSQWFVGSGAPGSIAGAVAGDQYLDEETGDVYVLE